MPRTPLLACLLLAACSRQDLAVYAVDKEPAAPHRHAGEAAPAAPAAPAEGRRVTWRVPSGWEEKPASGMRLATFLVPAAEGAAAEVSVSSFPGDAGGDLANVNRWRGQLGLGELAEGDLARHSRRLSSPAGPLLVVDFTGDGDKGRMIGARLLAGGHSWFFKMTGAERAVARAKPAFESFLGSLRHAR